MLVLFSGAVKLLKTLYDALKFDCKIMLYANFIKNSDKTFLSSLMTFDV